MSLRDELIKVLDDAVTNDGYWHLPTGQAEKGLDAILDTLEANAERWCESSDDTKMLDRAIPIELIEALRPPVSSSRDTPEKGER